MHPLVEPDTAAPVVDPTEPDGPTPRLVAPPVDLTGMAGLITRLHWLEEVTRPLLAEAEEVKAAIQDALGASEVGQVQGRTAVTWRYHVRSALDQKALRTERPEIFNQYQITTAVRRFHLHEAIDGADANG